MSEADITDPDEPVTYVDPGHGLWVPPRFCEFTRQIVFRTPRGTHQRFSPHDLDPFYPTIGADSFGPFDEDADLRNPDLAPDQLSIRPEGEPVETFTLEVRE